MDDTKCENLFRPPDHLQWRPFNLRAARLAVHCQPDLRRVLVSEVVKPQGGEQAEDALRYPLGYLNQRLRVTDLTLWQGVKTAANPFELASLAEAKDPRLGETCPHEVTQPNHPLSAGEVGRRGWMDGAFCRHFAIIADISIQSECRFLSSPERAVVAPGSKDH